MLRNSVDLIDRELSERLAHASTEQLRAAALVAVRFALAYADVNDIRITEALAELEQGLHTSESVIRSVQNLVTSLDDVQFDLHERVENGHADREEYSRAFRRARAADAVSQALNPDAFKAATEAIYEAKFASNDMLGLKARVLAALPEA